VVPLGTDIHQKVHAMLPWYVCASLDAADRVCVEAHVAECSRCQAELAWERKLRAAHASLETLDDVERGFALLRGRVEATASPRRRSGFIGRAAQRWQQSPAWMRWTLVGQCVAVLVLGSALLVALFPEQRYRALGGPAAAPGVGGTGNLIVRFRPAATEQEMRRVLRDNGARLVYGPTTTDAYLLAVPAGHEAAAVARLRKESAVMLAESLDGRASP
jgi:anti-sigma factor RsiW